MSQTSEARYICALDCGHQTYETVNRVAGIEWCYVCGAWRGVIVQRVDLRRASP